MLKSRVNYEEVRSENIRNNEIFLKELGLIENKIYKSEHKSDFISVNKPTKRKRVGFSNMLDDSTDYRVKGIRMSARLRGEKPSLHLIPIRNQDEMENDRNQRRDDDINMNMDETDIFPDDDEVIRKPITKTSLRDFIDASNREHGEIISDEAISHCVDRIHTMSNQRLATRLKVIARARGQHSTEKLLVSYYAFQLSALEELANSARSILYQYGVQVM